MGNPSRVRIRDLGEAQVLDVVVVSELFLVWL
jgi:hypothetical protein